jgi:ABC-type antimicrobial peptide transport system permease subunit
LTVALEMAVSGAIIVLGLIFSCVMGAVGGFIPAVNAMRLRPLESLR